MFWKVRSALPAVRHVALLGFEAPKGDDIAGQIAIGLENTLRAELSRAEARERDYWVSTDSETKATGSDARAIAQKLGANLILKGRIEPRMAATNVWLDLLEAPSGRRLRTAMVSRPRDQLYALTGDTVHSAAKLLNATLPEMAPEGAPRSAEAYRLYQDALAKLKENSLRGATSAIPPLQKVIQLDENFAPAFAVLASAYSLKYYYTHDLAFLDLTNRNCERALALNPALAIVHFRAGVAYRNTGQEEAGVRELRRALEIDPADFDALTYLGATYETQNQLVDAEKAYERILELRPNNWTAYNLFGDFSRRHGNYRKAEEMFLDVIQLAPTQGAGYTNLATVYLSTGRYGAAESRLRKSLSIQTTPAQLTNLGTALFFQGKLAEAERYTLEAIKLGPENDRRWRNLGDIRLQQGNVEGALDAYRRALTVVQRQLSATPGNLELVVNAALYFAKLSERQKARGMLSRLSNIASEDLELRLKVAMVDELVGQRQEALDLLRQLLAAGMPMRRITDSPEFRKIPSESFAGAGLATVTPGAGNSR